MLHHTRQIGQFNPTNNLENHMPRKTLEMFHQKNIKQKARSMKCLTQFEVTEFLVISAILQATDEGQREGQRDLVAFALSRSSRSLNDLI